MANALAGTSSPYLQQHAENPVDWHPWSDEVLERAKAEDKPLLISIGYSACHWCHVMAHESFENAEIAALMNEHFICIKVDREERPDIDAIYMDACQTLTGGGGWPLNAFATPDGRPFFAGTYFPPEPVQGMASWPQVLTTMAQTWAERRDEVEEQGTKLGEALSGGALLDPQSDIPGEDFLEEALAGLRTNFDSVHGGFGQAPKFPPSTVLGFLLRLDELPMAEYTLTSMATGGIFDQVGGGFSRYAVDERWSIPHFEKMLYDNAQLALRYAEAAHATGNDWYGQIAERTLDWVLRDLGDVDGGIASALDADSGGVEGSFYVWTPAQIREVLEPADAEAAIRWFAVTDAGNFEGGTTVLESRGEAPDPDQAGRIVLGLAAARESRAKPGRDGKRIVSWNALAIEALAASGVLLGRKDHLDEARRTAGIILDRALDENARVLRLIPTRRGEAARAGIPAGVLDDHAHLLQALVALYEATFEERWLRAAVGIAEALVRDFGDEERGGFFTTASDHEALITRRKDFDDSPIPSGQASAALGLLRLHALTGDRAHLQAAEGVLRLGAQVAAQHPIGLGQLLTALDQHAATPREVAIVGEGAAAEALIATAREYAGFTTVIAAGPPAGDDGEEGIVPLLAGRGLVDGEPAAYVCERFACQQPVTTPEALEELLD